MQPTIITTCGLLVAIVAAGRSTWSPCGISMLSTLTPYGERSRGHRYGATAAWFVAGTVVGGGVLGLVIAGLALAAAALSLSGEAVAAVVAAAGVFCVASDLRVGGLHLPLVPRQVNEQWVSGYRRWVYAGSFGAQIGIGFSTYVMTAAVYLMVVLGAMGGSPRYGWLIGLTFGTARGLAILLGATLSTPAAIRRFHERFEGLEPVSRAAAIVAQIVVVAVMVWAGGSPVLVTVGAGVAVVGGLALRRRVTVSGYAARSGA